MHLSKSNCSHFFPFCFAGALKKLYTQPTGGSRAVAVSPAKNSQANRAVAITKPCMSLRDSFIHSFIHW